MAAGKPLTDRQKRRIASVIEQAEQASGVEFVLYVGPAGDDTRAAAQELLTGLGHGQDCAIAMLVDPLRGRFELLPGEFARRRIEERDFALAAAGMHASFAVGDIAGGVMQAVVQLAEAARPDAHKHAPDLPNLIEVPAP